MKKMVVGGWLLAVGVAMAAGMAGAAGTETIDSLSKTGTRELKNGITYIFTENINVTMNATFSALKVADGATVTLVIPQGKTVTLKGGAASGKTGAGAGIELPEDATLYILGGGTLNAIGGKAANGDKGLNGGQPSAQDASGQNLVSGSGGGGGNGGGGAGAGIGGRGGTGGNGGEGVSGRSSSWDDSLDEDHHYGAGNIGNEGSPGGAGGNGGRVVVAESAHVTATGGAGGGVGTRGGIPGTGNRVRAVKHSGWHYVTFCGGGGGAGSGGGAACDVGGGGGGGGGGGSGGSGAIRYKWYAKNIYNLDGYGRGGGSPEMGGEGQTATGDTYEYDDAVQTWTAKKEEAYDDDDKDSPPGGGGVAGGRGAQGGTKEVEKLVASATVNGKSVLTGAGDNWVYVPESNTVMLLGGGQFAVSGDVKVEHETTLYPVLLTGLPCNKTLPVSGLGGSFELTTNDRGEAENFWLPSGWQEFTVGEGHAGYNVSSDTESIRVTYEVEITLDEHISSVVYKVGAGASE